MSYNGIGLKSAKGSSTSGHVQRSLAHNSRDALLNYNARKAIGKSKKSPGVGKRGEGQYGKNTAKLHKSISDRITRRDIDLQVSELRDYLEDQQESNTERRKKKGECSNQKVKHFEELTDAIIDDRCNELREKLLKEFEESQRLNRVYKRRSERDNNDSETENNNTSDS